MVTAVSYSFPLIFHGRKFRSPPGDSIFLEFLYYVSFKYLAKLNIQSLQYRSLKTQNESSRPVHFQKFYIPDRSSLWTFITLEYIYRMWLFQSQKKL
jgi:hypothetical protein